MPGTTLSPSAENLGNAAAISKNVERRFTALAYWYPNVTLSRIHRGNQSGPGHESNDRNGA